MLAIDLGTDTTKIARWVKSNRADLADTSEIVKDDMNNTSTPMYIAFRGQKMNACDHATQGIRNNLDNYIWGLKRVIGSNCLIKNVDEEIKQEQLKSNIKVEDDLISYKVRYDNKDLDITPEHALSIILEYVYYLSKKTVNDGFDGLKELSKKCNNENQIIMSIPSYYTAAHLKGIQVALDAKGFKEIHFIRDYIATAIEYGYYRNSTRDFINPKVVLFVDMGESATTATLVRYSQDKIEILDTGYNMIGGGQFTYKLKQKLKEMFEEEAEYEFDDDDDDEEMRKINKKQLYLIGTKARKLKQDFSSENTYELDCEIEILNEDDEEAEIEVEKEPFFEDCNDLFKEFDDFINNFLSKACKKDNIRIDVCELSGGSMRMTQLRKIVLKYIQQYGCSSISGTLNADQCVVQGTCLAGQLILNDKMLDLPTSIVDFEYIDYDNKRKHHQFTVYGCGKGNTSNTGYTLYNTKDEFIMNDPKEHDYHKVSCSINSNTRIIEGGIMIEEEWIELRNSCQLEVDNTMKKLSDSHPKREVYSKRLNDYNNYFTSLPIARPDDKKVQEVRNKLEELIQLKKEFEEIWNYLGENCYICTVGDEMLNGTYVLYGDESKKHPFGSCTFKNNKLCGLWKEEDENKNVILEIEYYEDKKVYSKRYYSDGSIKQVRHYKNDYLERVISFYNKSRIEYLHYTAIHSNIKIFYYEKGIIKRIVLKRFSSKKENSDDDDNDNKNGKKKMYEFNNDGYLLYEGDFVTKTEQKENKRIKNYYRSGEGCLFFYNAGFIEGTFEAACDKENGMNSPMNEVVKVRDRKTNDTKSYQLNELFNPIKLKYNNCKFVKDYDVWTKSKLNKKHTKVKLNNSKHIVNKAVHFGNDKNKSDYMIYYGLCNCGIKVLNVKTQEERLLYPVIREHISSKMTKLYPDILYWNEKDTDKYSNITDSIVGIFELSTYGLVVNKNVCELCKTV